jgi:signal transduction histidine kinase
MPDRLAPLQSHPNGADPGMDSMIGHLQRLGIAAASLGPDRLIREANEAFAEAVGGSREALAGREIRSVLSAAAANMLGEGPATAYCFVDGAAMSWLRLDIKSADNGFLAILTDVSHEYAVLDDIRSFYVVRDRLLMDGKIGTWRYDPDAELYYFSSELSLGHEGAGAPVPVAMLQLIQHLDDRDKDTAIRERITREGGMANAEMRYLENGGGWTHLNVHYRAGRRMPSGLYEIIGISQNITAVAVARDEAEQFSQRLALALRAAQAGVFEYNYAQASFWASPELAALVGEEGMKHVGQDVSIFVMDDRARAQAFFDAARTASAASSIELRMDQPDGYRWVKLYFGVRDRDAEGKPLLGVGLLIDIDDRKRQEIALAEARQAADFANRSKTEFLANMSHELRTPLNAILGFSEMIEQQMFGAVDGKYVGYAHDIHHSGNHLLSLINDVLDLSKLEAGKLELRETDIALPALVEDCLALVRRRADAAGVRLTSCLALSLPQLRADARAIKQVLLNFLSNAVKFTPEGGQVTVNVECKGSGKLCLSVTDTGIGMSAADIAIALQPFGQVDSNLARKNEGTGLGLPICKSLVELHGGELSVTSEPNAGTTMTAIFPASRTIEKALARAG